MHHVDHKKGLYIIKSGEFEIKKKIIISKYYSKSKIRSLIQKITRGGENLKKKFPETDFIKRILENDLYILPVFI